MAADAWQADKIFRRVPMTWNCLKNSFWSHMHHSRRFYYFIRMYTQHCLVKVNKERRTNTHSIMLCSSLAYTYLISDLEWAKVDTGQCTPNNIYYSVYGTLTQTIMLTWTASKQWKTMEIACAAWAMTSNWICFFAVGCHEYNEHTQWLNRPLDYSVICDRFADSKGRNENSTWMYSNFNITWLGNG